MTTYNTELIIINEPLSKKKTSFLNRAIELAYGSDCSMRMASVVVKAGRVLATGVNSLRNTPDDMYLGDISYHAEMAAIRQLRGHDNKYTAARGATIYTARILKDDTPALARPCDNCYEALCAIGIGTIVYTTSGPFPSFIS